MSEVTKKILNTIKGEGIKPKPRWHFIVRQILIWLMSLLSVVVGSFAFSVILFRIVNSDWEIPKLIGRSPVLHFFNTLPYIWIVLLILFIGLAYYNSRHTKGAYKYHAYWFVVGSIVASIALGSILYAFGMGPRVHMMARRLPIMQQLMLDREAVWLEPENGFLAGEVIGLLSGAGMFELEDLENKIWVIRPGDEYYPPPPHFTIEEGVMIRIYGEKIDEEVFEAIKVLPYQMGPGTMKGRVDIKESCKKYDKCKRMK